MNSNLVSGIIVGAIIGGVIGLIGWAGKTKNNGQPTTTSPDPVPPTQEPLQTVVDPDNTTQPLVNNPVTPAPAKKTTSYFGGIIVIVAVVTGLALYNNYQNRGNAAIAPTQQQTNQTSSSAYPESFKSKLLSECETNYSVSVCNCTLTQFENTYTYQQAKYYDDSGTTPPAAFEAQVQANCQG